ncbi:hypothetical protein QN277_029343 [Acacia crassicarpa]|uniref:CRC domain-containing protein n=1 Tax=Acacia crassicarpa TaxID=499986 RepID=A0AAE1J5D5_9FABA|nr:hypothetical protein QN277_029343 [Acacia crassicarpa]
MNSDLIKSLQDPFQDFTGEVLTSQSLEVPVSTSQSLRNVSNLQHVHAQQYQNKPTPLQSFGHNHQIIQLSTPPKKRQKLPSKRCRCKANKCQKGYCECYAAGELWRKL